MSDNIVGKNHLPYVQKQIKARQKILGKNSNSPEFIGNYNSWANGKSAWVRLASSVDIADQQILVYNSGSSTWNTASDNGANFRSQYLDLPDYKGAELSKELVLQGGTVNSSDLNTGNLKFGVTNNTSNLPNSGFNYGFGGTEFGLVPMPGITSFDSKTNNKGSLRFANITIQANNRKQFEYLESVYLRLGYTMLLEWGNSSYPISEDDGTISFEQNNISLIPDFLDNPPTNDASHFYTLIEKKRKESQGNYDAFLSKVENYSWEFTKEGKYIINLRLITIGSVIESLQMNVVNDSGIFVGPGQSEGKAQDQKENSLLTILNTILKPKPKANTKETKDSFIIPFGAPTITPGGALGLILGYFFNEVETSINFDSTVSLPPETRTTIDMCFATFGSNDFVRYLRFGTLLEIINQRFLLYGDNVEKPLFISLDTNLDQYCFSNAASISADPSKMIIRFGGDLAAMPLSIFNEGENKIEIFHDVVEDVQVGRIMNLYFSYDFLKEVIESNTDKKTGKLSLYDLLKALLDEASNLLGGVNKFNLRITEKDFDGTISQVVEFYDEVSPFESYKLLKDEDNSKLVVYGLNTVTPFKERSLGLNADGVEQFETTVYPSYTEGSFVTDYQFRTELSKDFATMVSVGAQANGQAVGEDATIFSKWNLGLVDRLFPKKFDSDQAIKDQNQQTQIYLKVLTAYSDYISLFQTTETNKEVTITNDLGIIDLTQNYTGYSFPNVNLVASNPNDKTLTGFIAIQKTFFQKFTALEAISKNRPTPFIGFLPINLSLTFDGLSGMRIFDKLSVDSRFLPSNYGDTLDFIITKLDHKISNNKWETNVETLSIPKLFNNTKLSLNLENILNLLPPKVNSSEDNPVGRFGFNYSALGNLMLTSLQYLKDNPGIGTGNTVRKNTNGNFTLPTQKLGEGFMASPLISIGNIKGKSGNQDMSVSVPGTGVVTSSGIKLTNQSTNNTYYDGHYYLAEPAALQLIKFAQFCESQGKSFTITSAYRSYNHQNGLKSKDSSATTAKAGSSAHGLGGAIDIQELISRDGNGKLTSNPTINQTFRTVNPNYKFWQENAPRFGWYNPQRLRDGAGVDESWHWEYWGVPGEKLQIKPPTNDSLLTFGALLAGVQYLGFGEVPTLDEKPALNIHGYTVEQNEETGQWKTISVKQ
jgi:hypothetical protein